MTTDQLLNISEAARASSKSIPTIRAYLEAGKLPNASSTAKGKSRSWLIPLTDLIAAGLIDRVSSSSPEAADSELMQIKLKVAALEAENEQLRERIKDLATAREDLLAAYRPMLETLETQKKRRRFWGS